MSIFTIFLLFISSIDNSEALSCDQTAYRSKIQQQLQSLITNGKYKIIEGTLSIEFNSSYTAANPNTAFGTYIFPNGADRNSANWPLGASDAIIFSGCTTPDAKYFAFQHYINYRTVPNNSPKQLFADLGAATNDLVINTSSDTNNTFDSLTTVIVTGDKQTEMDLRNVLDPETLNFLTIPDEFVYFQSYDNNSENATIDTFEILYRNSVWYNLTELNEYISMMNGMIIWKLTPTNLKGNKPRIPYKPYTRNNICTYNETVIYENPINEYEQDLIKYIEQKYSYKFVYSSEFINGFLPPKHYYGFECIENNLNCYGETRDAQYWSVGNPNKNPNVTIHFDDNSFYLVLGINQVNTLQSGYISIVIENRSETGLHPQGDYTDLQLNESALILPVNSNVNKEYIANMWMIQVSRPANCLYNDSDLLIPGFCFDKNTFNQDTFVLEARNYLNPQTKTRPNRTQIVPPRLLYFSV